MKLTFLGATHEVTGSCTLLETQGKNILIDYGMEQGNDIFINQELPVNPRDIDCVLLTHAHIDHSGNLPLLYKYGFRGKIYATEETSSLCNIMLLDSAHIQMFEAKWQNRKAKRSGKAECRPVYDVDDAMGAISKFIPCKYNQTIPILENLAIRFSDVGHLLGSSCIEIWVKENDQVRKIVFSGDIGNNNQPLIKDPCTLDEADYVVIESTYGDRYHEDRPDHIAILTDYIQETFDRGGNLVIPSFAVGRTQELLYFIRQIKEQNLIKGHKNFPVYIDSPLANEATSIFLQCNTDCFDDETKALIQKGINPIYFDDLKVSLTSDDSKLINADKTPKIIISASGMCEAGRIRHHLKHNLWRKECTILFVGYQAMGTLGRTLYEGIDEVKLFGETIAVNAQIATLPGISGHADKQGLINWLMAFKDKPKTVFVNHGEDSVCSAFAGCLKYEYGFNTIAPYSGSCYDLLSGETLTSTVGIPVVKKSSQKGSRSSMLFNKLVDAAKRLMIVVKQSEGMPNKELAKFADQIHSLCDKWIR